MVGVPPAAAGDGLRLAVEPHLATDTIAAFIELYTDTPASLENVSATFELADDQDAPALAKLPGSIRSTLGGTRRYGLCISGANGGSPFTNLSRAS